MGDKKKGLTHSQTIGIVWLSVVLLLIAGMLLFSRQTKLNSLKNNPQDTRASIFLTQQEDSVYQTRHKNHTTNNIHRSKTYKATPKTDIKEAPVTTYRKPASKKQPLVVDLNTADTVTLQLLHGIGPTYARRIVRYREQIGGFHSADQLLEVYGFTPELLSHIAPYLTLDSTAIRRININSIELKQLAKHPYIEYYQARDIITLRNRGIRFSSVDDLRAIPSMADSTLARLLPYLDFNHSAE